MKTLAITALLIAFSRSSNVEKINFVVKDCKISLNENTYGPCGKNVYNRIIVYDNSIEEWIFYLDKTEKYKVIHGKDKKLTEASDMIIYQVIDEKNIPMVLLYILSRNTNGTLSHQLVKKNGLNDVVFTLDRI